MTISSPLRHLMRTWSKLDDFHDEHILSLAGSGDDSSVASITAFSSSSSSSSSSSNSSIRRKWEAMALHRFLSPKTCARETVPLSQTKLLHLLRTLPHATTTVDRRGRTPLHLACTNRYATPTMISMLLDAPGGKDALLMQDEEGFTPLHCATRFHPDNDLIPQLVAADPHVTTIRDNAGMTPLHHACAHLTSISSTNLMSINAPAMAVLLQHDPSIALARAHDGNTPFSLACNKFDLICRQGCLSITGRPRVVTFGSFLFLERTVPIMKAIGACSSNSSQKLDLNWLCSWDNMLHCALGAVKGAAEADDITISKNNKITCEFAILSIIHRCKDQALMFDSLGNTPLHIASSIPPSSVPVGSRLLYPTTDKYIVRDKCVVDYLVRLCPDAAHKRNHDGRLPLQNIVEAGGSSWKYGVRSIVDANPKAVADLDLDSRLYPNVLGRVGSDIGLNAVFSILKEKPDLVSASSGTGSGDAVASTKVSKKSRSLRVVRRNRHR